MKTTVRIARRLLAEIDDDLDRAHEFAGERLGFVLARWAQVGIELVVIPFRYISIADENYIDDAKVGAKMNSAAIRAALQATLDHGATCLHVHAHHPAMPFFGDLDLAEQAKLMPSFRAAVPNAPHGALLLHGTGALARLWPSGGGPPVYADRVTVVGFPMRFSWRGP
jgi:hypothetical protein